MLDDLLKGYDDMNGQDKLQKKKELEVDDFLKGLRKGDRNGEISLQEYEKIIKSGGTTRIK